MTVHLYDPASKTHYTNGGEIAIDSQAPAGMQWKEGLAPSGSGFYTEPPKDLPGQLELAYNQIMQNLGPKILTGEVKITPDQLLEIVSINAQLNATSKMPFVTSEAYAKFAQYRIHTLPPYLDPQVEAARLSLAQLVDTQAGPLDPIVDLAVKLRTKLQSLPQDVQDDFDETVNDVERAFKVGDFAKVRRLINKPDEVLTPAGIAGRDQLLAIFDGVMGGVQ